MVIALVICIVIILILSLKLYLMKKAAREIAGEYEKRMWLDTNTLIGISSQDKDMKRLANDINRTLKEVRQAYHRYREGDREMKMAVTNISHDLRTPLTAICGYLSFIKKLDKSEELERYFDIIEDRALYMKKLTEELFEYSVIISSETTVEKEEVWMNRLLEDCIMEHYAVLVEKGIALEANITEEKIVHRVNSTQIERVFSNLISNALKYSDGDLKISMTDKGVITFVNKAKALDKLHTERLFDRFYTVESARNSTGLGLSIARKFVEENGGNIIAEYDNDILSITIVFSKETGDS